MNYQFDYIIPLCNVGGPEFKYRLNTVKNTLNKIPDNINVILVEQIIKNEETYTSFLENKYTTIIVKHPEFNKMWLYNLGVKKAKTQNVLLTDADVSFTSPYFTKLSEFLEKSKIDTWCFGWNEGHILNEDGSLSKITSPKYRGYEGFIVYFNKNFFEEIGTCNEWIIGIGGDDNELAVRSKGLSSTYITAPIVVSHIYHPYNKLNACYYNGTNNEFQELRQRNIKILETAAQNPRLVARALIDNIDSLGQTHGPLVKYIDCPFI